MAKSNLYIWKLSNGEAYRMVTGLLRDIQASKLTVEDPVLTKLKDRLTQEANLFAEGLAKAKEAQNVKELENADKLRDQQLQLLIELVKLGRLAQTPEEKAAYEAVAPLLKGASKAKKANYEEESAYILTLLANFKKTDYQPHLRTLNLTKIVQQLTKSQEAFDALLTKRHSSHTTKVVYDNKKTRKDLQETYTKLVTYLKLMAEEATPVAYSKLYKLVQANSQTFKPLALDNKARPKPPQVAEEAEKEAPANTETP